MITAALIAAIALAITATGFAIWMAKRGFGYADKLEEALVVARLSEKQLADATIALAERDHSIEELTSQARRMRAALDIAEGETPPLEIKEKPGATIKQSMDALRASAKPKTPLPSILTPRPLPAPPAGAAPGSVTGGIGMPVPGAAVGGTVVGRPPGPPAADRPSRDPVHGPDPKPGK